MDKVFVITKTKQTTLRQSYGYSKSEHSICGVFASFTDAQVELTAIEDAIKTAEMNVTEGFHISHLSTDFTKISYQEVWKDKVVIELKIVETTFNGGN
jgi:hypothetical protein